MTDAPEPQLQILEAALLEAQESLQASKLLNEKQTAELNAKELLLARKNERIEELLQSARDRETQIGVKNGEIVLLTTRLTSLETEIRDLQDQLRKEEEEFSMICAALEAKEKALAKQAQQVESSTDSETQLRKELDRAQVMIRRLERNVQDAHPEQADACLSPRSFHENQLIQLRDDAIQAKTREVWLLMGQNDQLRVQMDALEGAMQDLQANFMANENEVARKQRKIEKLEAEMDALQASRIQAEGREKAMEIATTQNAKLLQALEAQEYVNEELQERALRAERDCEQLRSTHRSYLEKSAVNEVEVMHKTREAEEKNNIVNGLQEKLQRERRSLQEELSSARLNFQLEIEKMQSELIMRRNKQYELTLKLQDVEARYHDAGDALETTTERLQATQCRMEELELVLQDALEWKRQLETTLATQKLEAAKVSSDQTKRLVSIEKEATVLKAQLRELTESMAKKISHEKHMELQLREAKQRVEAERNLASEQKERIRRLVQELTRESQARAELELEQQLVREQMDSLRHQMEVAMRDAVSQQRKIEEKSKSWADKHDQLAKECALAEAGKCKLVQKYAEAFKVAVTANSTHIISLWSSSGSLDLRECSLIDQDLRHLLRMLEGAPSSLTYVDLRSNRLTFDGMRVLLQFAQKTLQARASQSIGAGSYAPSLREIDLRQNFISIDGIRLVASGLGHGGTDVANSTSNLSYGSPSLQTTSSLVKHVVVANDGRIECFAPPSSEVSGKEPILVINITSNFDPDMLAAEMRKRSRRTKPVDIGNNNAPQSCAVAKNSATGKDPLEEIYGVDLVNEFLGSGNKFLSSSMSQAGNNSNSMGRRKSISTKLDKPTEQAGSTGLQPRSSTPTLVSYSTTDRSGSIPVLSPRIAPTSSLPRLSG